MHVSISAFASLIACHFAFWSSSSERSCARIHAVLRPRLWGEGRARLYRAISALVDLPGVASPLECDWWLLEGCASGLVMSGLSQDVRDGRDKIRNSRNYGSQGNSIFLAYTVNTVSFDMAWFGAIFREYLISVKINCYLFCDCSTKRIIHYRFSVAHFTCFVTYCTQHSEHVLVPGPWHHFSLPPFSCFSYCFFSDRNVNSIESNANKNLCGRDGRTICGRQCVPKVHPWR